MKLREERETRRRQTRMSESVIIESTRFKIDMGCKDHFSKRKSGREKPFMLEIRCFKRIVKQSPLLRARCMRERGKKKEKLSTEGFRNEHLFHYKLCPRIHNQDYYIIAHMIRSGRYVGGILDSAST